MDQVLHCTEQQGRLFVNYVFVIRVGKLRVCFEDRVKSLVYLLGLLHSKLRGQKLPVWRRLDRLRTRGWVMFLNLQVDDLISCYWNNFFRFVKRGIVGFFFLRETRENLEGVVTRNHSFILNIISITPFLLINRTYTYILKLKRILWSTSSVYTSTI